MQGVVFCCSSFEVYLRLLGFILGLQSFGLYFKWIVIGLNFFSCGIFDEVNFVNFFVVFEWLFSLIYFNFFCWFV